MKKNNKTNELLNQVFNKVRGKSPRSFISSSYGYYHIGPKPLNMDNGNVLNVEWLQASDFTIDVLINWRTDRVKASSLSEKELEQLLEIV